MAQVSNRVLLVLLAVLGLAPAWSHPAPFSYLDMVFKNGGIEGTLVVHVIDVAHELGVQPEQVMDPAFVASQQKRIGEILAPRLDLEGNQRLSIEWLGAELMREEQAVKFHYRIPNANFGSLSIDTSLFPYAIHCTRRSSTSTKRARFGSRRSSTRRATRASTRGGTTQGAVEVMKTIGAINTIFGFKSTVLPLMRPRPPPASTARIGPTHGADHALRFKPTLVKRSHARELMPDAPFLIAPS